mmetsp:Transcript_18653/g.57341  ORF Transcript_18653/g.57341 Transcript_18653/m.57341 type:complete len:200 (+) Transcript_18653:224-823(+)
MRKREVATSSQPQRKTREGSRRRLAGDHNNSDEEKPPKEKEEEEEEEGPTSGLEALEGLDGVVEDLVGLGDGGAPEEGAEGLEEELDVLDGVVALDLFVEVGVEGDLLDVLGFAHVDEGLAGGVGGVEDLLEDVEDGVGGFVELVVGLQVQFLELLLRRELGALGHGLDDGFTGHAARLGREVDALARALGDVAGGVSH